MNHFDSLSVIRRSFMEEKKPRINKDTLFIFQCAIGWGVIAHGMALFNKYCFHDDSEAFNGIGVTYNSGRWMLGLMGEWFTKLVGSRHYSLPIVNGMITIFCLAVILFLIFDMLELHDRAMICFVSGIVVSFPTIAAVMGYMFTAPYYYFGLLLGIAGLYLHHRYHNVFSFAGAMLLIACAMGTYQANLPFIVCVVLLLLIHKIYTSDGRWLVFFAESFKSLLLLAASCFSYFLLNNMFLKLKNTTLWGYMGISTFGMTDPSGYLSRIVFAIKEFLNPVENTRRNMYPFNAKYLHIALIVMFTVLTLILFIQIFKTNRKKSFQILLLISVFPLAAYLILVMVDTAETNVHGLMTFGYVCTFLLAGWIYENFKAAKGILLLLKKTALVMVALMVFMNIRFDNMCYIKANMLQSHAISYYTTLITKIKSVDGYKNELPIVYINDTNKRDIPFAGTTKHFDVITLVPYHMFMLINDYSWESDMKYWCGFYRPEIISPEPYEQMEVVRNMPNYPDDGSIQIVDGVIIVKFNDITD